MLQKAWYWEPRVPPRGQAEMLRILLATTLADSELALAALLYLLMMDRQFWPHGSQPSTTPHAGSASWDSWLI